MRIVGLSEELAAHLNRVVPEDVALAALPGGSIRILAGAERNGWAEVQWWWPEQPPESFARSVLETLQNELIEHLCMGWPPADPRHPSAPQSATQLPEPDAIVIDGTLHWWYGDRHAPALALPTVKLESA